MEMQTSRQNMQPVRSSITNDQFKHTNVHMYVNNELVVRNNAAMAEIATTQDGSDKNGRARWNCVPFSVSHESSRFPTNFPSLATNKSSPIEFALIVAASCGGARTQRNFALISSLSMINCALNRSSICDNFDLRTSKCRLTTLESDIRLFF